MINYVNFDLFYKNSVPKETTITYSGGTITNTDLYLDGMSLVEGINSTEQLQFGNAEAAEFRMKIASANLTVPSLVGEELDVSMVLDGDTANPFHFGKYTVVSDTPDRLGYYREVVAYDALYEVFSKDFGAWYNAQTFPMTLKQFRDGFFAQAGITQETVTLANDGMTVTKTISPEVLTGKAIITAICEINGVFGHIGRDGKFKYVELVATHPALYPADDIYPDDTLYPADETGTPVPGARIINGDYESYYSDNISKLTIRDDDESVGVTVGSGANEYTVTNNFLLYGMSTANLTTVATNMFDVIKNAYYRPAELTVVGNPCLEVGDAYNANCNGEVVRSYILERKITGTQFLEDTYTAEGHDAIEPNSNSLMAQIERLNGASHKLIVDDQTFYSQIFDSQGNSKIAQNSNAIGLEVTRAVNAENALDGRINIEAGKIAAKVSKVSPTGQTNFAWEMTDSKMEWTTNGNTIMLLNSSGLYVKGEIEATSGKIAGFEISSTALTDGNNHDLLLYDDDNSQVLIGNTTVDTIKIQSANYAEVWGEAVNIHGVHYLDLYCYRQMTISSDTKVQVDSDLEVTGSLSVDGSFSPSTLTIPSGGTFSFEGHAVTWKRFDLCTSSDFVLVEN